jgi:transcription initiation factor TFIID TATA-box-binding protein
MPAKKDFKIRIENIVASATLGTEIPLEKIASKSENVEYEPEQFPGLVYRTKDPVAASLIFSSGKIVCTGARSVKDVKNAMKKIIRLIKRSGVKVPKTFRTEIENIVASAKFEGRLNLDSIAFNLERSEYEPEQFPGLVYRMDSPKVAFLLFSSGKIVCTGARSVKDVKEAINKIYKKLKSIKAIVKE